MCVRRLFTDMDPKVLQRLLSERPEARAAMQRLTGITAESSMSAAEPIAADTSDAALGQ